MTERGQEKKGEMTRRKKKDIERKKEKKKTLFIFRTLDACENGADEVVSLFKGIGHAVVEVQDALGKVLSIHRNHERVRVVDHRRRAPAGTQLPEERKETKEYEQETG